jgi:hypothetical protein
MAALGQSVHNPQHGPVSLTSVTERGTVYSLDEIRAVVAVAKEFGSPVHLDGARSPTPWRPRLHPRRHDLARGRGTRCLAAPSTA